MLDLFSPFPLLELQNVNNPPSQSESTERLIPPFNFPPGKTKKTSGKARPRKNYFYF